jgi:preprotein translocase subunit SecA
MKSLAPYHSITDLLRSPARQPRRSDYELVHRIRARHAEIKNASDRELRETADHLRNRIDAGAAVLECDILVDAFSLVCESCSRVLNKVPYDEQILSGLAMATGAVAEMQTGEGKTIAATLPAFLHGLTRQGVHVATVNQYLADRDHELLAPVFENLGLSVGISREKASNAEKRAAYQCDIVYATGYELGFDYLRDRVSERAVAERPLGQSFRAQLRGQSSSPALIQRAHNFCIIDEVDSVLLDEACTPLIISGTSSDVAATAEAYRVAKKVAADLRVGEQFEVLSESRSIRLLDQGMDRIYEIDVSKLALQRPWHAYVQNALSSQYLMHRDVDYVVRSEEIQIVDQNTGRVFDERSWRAGLHQAVEAKEDVTITPEKRSLARISRQRYFQMYDQLSGMTGTATGHELEFRKFYQMPIVKIPLRKCSARNDQATRFFADQKSKWKAIIDDVEQRSLGGQPILVGTRTIEQSLMLSSRLREIGVTHQLLNGLQDADEAELIARAGAVGSVTVATNMAGRGTDIPISAEARSLGGLHVLGTDRNTSPRVDRQLIGRTGRQGEAGSSQFFVSADDFLIANYRPELIGSMVRTAGTTGELTRNFENQLRRIQTDLEQEQFRVRQNMLDHQLWLDQLLVRAA